MPLTPKQNDVITWFVMATLAVIAWAGLFKLWLAVF